MKVLVIGPSITVEPDTWPSFLRESLNCELVNLSRTGCGNDYIFEAALTELSQRSYDLVIISWTDFNRVEFKTHFKIPPAELDTIFNTNAELLQPDWIFNNNMNYNEEVRQLYQSWARVCYDSDRMYQTMLLKIIALQGFLKSKQIPYAFLFYSRPVGLKRFANLYDQIDWNYVHHQHLYQIAKKNNWWKDRHPTTQAHQAYSHRLLDFIHIKNLAAF